MEKQKTKKKLFARIADVYMSLLDKLYAVLSEKRKLLVFLAAWSFILNYFLEVGLRKNLLLGFVHIATQPLTYLYNVLIVFCSFVLILFFKRRLFYFVVASVFWLALAITDYVVLLSRNTPLNAPDFRIIKSALGIIKIYLNLFEQIMVICLILFAIFLLVIAFIKGKKSERHLYFAGSAAGVTVSVTLALTMFVSSAVSATHFSDLPTAYKEYGFAFSFLSSVIDRGIDKPETYDDEQVLETLKTELDMMESDSAEVLSGVSNKTPNIVFLQLESFYDPTNISNLSFSEDPVPIFRGLKESCMSGKFTVPSIGAGTANTEFEVITGMDIDFFGVAEYPYLSVLQDNACESIAYNMKEYGYAAHAMHNHTGSFYDRHIVFPNLGFDTFTSVENMNPIVRNELGWAKDSMLVDEIYGVIESTPGQPDVVCAISVQAHGKYPVDKESFDEIYNESHPAHIKISGNEEDPQKHGVDYWINQIHDVDAFIGSLVNRFKEFSEPTVIVMYGDHLPAFELDTWALKEGNLYQTDYVIWSNFELEQKGDRDLNSYEIASYVLHMFGFESGYINALHGTYSGTDEDYSEELHLLQYDLLYGDKKLYQESEFYVPTNIKYGYKKISVTDVNVMENNIFVYGEGFNEYSEIYINGNKKNTSFINTGCLSAGNVKLNDGDVVKIVQVTTDMVEVGESLPYEYNK